MDKIGFTSSPATFSSFLSPHYRAATTLTSATPNTGVITAAASATSSAATAAAAASLGGALESNEIWGVTGVDEPSRAELEVGVGGGGQSRKMRLELDALKVRAA